MLLPQHTLLGLGLWLAGVMQVEASPASILLQANLREGERRQLVPDGCVKYDQTKSPACSHCNGDGCGSFHCSSFTSWHSCDTLGPGWEQCGYETCQGGFCEHKRVCGRYCDASKKTVKGIDSINYDTDSKHWEIQKGGATASVEAVYNGANAGSIPQETGSVQFSITETQTSLFSFSSGTTVSTSFTAGIPAISGGSLTVGASETITVGKSYTKTFTVQTTANAGNLKLAPYSRQVLRFSFEAQQYQIPFTAQVTMEDGCGSESKSSIKGTVTIKGVANTASGSATWEVGPVIPWRCKSPFGVPFDKQVDTEFCPNTASDQCKLNVMCDPTAFGTDCGCTGDKPLPCCSTARAHSKCNGYPPDSIICPNAQGQFNACCNEATY